VGVRAQPASLADMRSTPVFLRVRGESFLSPLPSAGDRATWGVSERVAPLKTLPNKGAPTGSSTRDRSPGSPRQCCNAGGDFSPSTARFVPIPGLSAAVDSSGSELRKHSDVGLQSLLQRSPRPKSRTESGKPQPRSLAQKPRHSGLGMVYVSARRPEPSARKAGRGRRPNCRSGATQAE
jgi:hypothetical protein